MHPLRAALATLALVLVLAPAATPATDRSHAPRVRVANVTAQSAQLVLRRGPERRLVVGYGLGSRIALYSPEIRRNGVRRFALVGLRPGSRYRWQLLAGGRVISRGRFRTPIRSSAARTVRRQGRRILLDGQPFLPIMQWAQCPEEMAANRAVGVDVFFGPACKNARDQLRAARRHNALAIVPFERGLQRSPALFGYHFEDEPDANNTSPATIAAQGRTARRAPGSHLTFLTLTRGFHAEFGASPWHRHDPVGIYRAYARASDVAGFVLYPYWILCEPGRLHQVADLQREFVSSYSPGRPTFQWIEAAARNNPSCSGERATPVSAPEVAAEAWMAIVNGATGVAYFTMTFHEGTKRFDVRPEVARAMYETNVELKALAPALLAHPRAARVRLAAPGRVDVTARTFGGARYLIAVNVTSSPAQATFTLPGAKGRSIRRYHDGARLALRKGRFADTLPPFGRAVYIVAPR